jgi:hypothetical protein
MENNTTAKGVRYFSFSFTSSAPETGPGSRLL